MITKADIKVLEAQDNDTLARWWAVLNHWEWPEELPDPAESHHMPACGRDRRGQIMQWIHGRVPAKALARAWAERAYGDAFNLAETNQWWTIHGSPLWGDLGAVVEVEGQKPQKGDT